MAHAQVLVGLGGNLGDVEGAFTCATATLGRRFPIGAVSDLWRTAPLGPPQPDFLNAALLLACDVHPLELLAACLEVERVAGRRREREQPLGPRPLDIDLLLVRDVVIEGPALRLPHPRLAERRFALAPAAQIAPRWVHPRIRRTLADLAAVDALSGQRCERIGPFPRVPPD